MVFLSFLALLAGVFSSASGLAMTLIIVVAFYVLWRLTSFRVHLIVLAVFGLVLGMLFASGFLMVVLPAVFVLTEYLHNRRPRRRSARRS